MSGRSGPPEPPPFPQNGIFTLGTGSHIYLELDAARNVGARSLVRAVAGLREPQTTLAGVNLVAGFRPELWRRVVPAGVPRGTTGFNRPLRGIDRFVMPATQHDLVLWLSGVALDVVFDEARAAIRTLRGIATVADETVGWPYRHDRDLTGFVDGTENPTLFEATSVGLVPAGRPGAGGSVLLLQKWHHLAEAWEGLPDSAQEQVMGRTKAESVELDPKPRGSHAERTDQDVFGQIFRRNVAYGSVTDHGTLFVGFCASQRPLAEMLRSMAGLRDGTRDALTLYTRPLSGAYYFVPSLEALRRFDAPPHAGNAAAPTAEA